jgi:ectoine hydroxylase-related dioxygenase (phytanoyl-CoA dioxygenase family)
MNDSASLYTIERALEECGVTDSTLTPGEKASLDNQGYLLLAEVMDAKWLERLRKFFEAAIPPGNLEPGGKQTGTRHASDLSGSAKEFEAVITHPRVLAAAHHVLGCPFRLAHLGGRDPLPGYGQQGLHSDWLPRAPSEPYRVATAIWLLDEFTSNNGATRVVPGTHRLCAPVPKAMSAPANRHPDQKIVVARRGSVLVFNGHLWHSGTQNQSKDSRRVLQCQFVGRDEFRMTAAKLVSPERFSEAARYILAV